LSLRLDGVAELCPPETGRCRATLMKQALALRALIARSGREELRDAAPAAGPLFFFAVTLLNLFSQLSCLSESNAVNLVSLFHQRR
jgi:hypothetical protein